MEVKKPDAYAQAFAESHQLQERRRQERTANDNSKLRPRVEWRS
jgi:hypothetical protein